MITAAAAARDLEAEDPVGRTTTKGVEQSNCDLAQRDRRRGTVPMSSPLFWAWSSPGRRIARLRGC